MSRRSLPCQAVSSRCGAPSTPAFDAILANLGWQPELKDLNRLEAGGQVVYPIFRDRPLITGLELVFSDESAARDAADAAMRESAFAHQELGRGRPRRDDHRRQVSGFAVVSSP